MHYLMPAIYLGLGSLFKTGILFGLEATEAAAEIRYTGLHKLTIRGVSGAERNRRRALADAACISNFREFSFPYFKITV